MSDPTAFSDGDLHAYADGRLDEARRASIVVDASALPAALLAEEAFYPVLGAWPEGWRRVLKAPALSASLLVLTLAMAVPLGAALGGMIESHLGASTAAEGPAWNWDAGWAAEFAAQAQGLGRTFTHEIIGFGEIGRAHV